MQNSDKNNSNTFLYKFLITPQFRIWRHLLLLFAVFIISSNQASMAYIDHLDKLNYEIYLIILAFFLTNIIVGYFNIYILVPKYLAKREYIAYIVIMMLSILFLVLAQYKIEFIANYLLDLPPGSNSVFNSNSFVLLEVVSSYLVSGVCIAGVSITVLLKHWMMYSSKVSQLEKKHIQSEVEQLKDQVTPLFLFNILNRTGVSAKSDSEKSSNMLMKLSQILRYQLYDCNRDKVFLSSEISFINNYLNLQKLYFDSFEYKIIIKGDIYRIILPPLLFIPFIQNIINDMSVKSKELSINLVFEIGDGIICFQCNCNDTSITENSNLSNIKQRLNLLFSDRYTLDVIEDVDRNNMLRLQINL